MSGPARAGRRGGRRPYSGLEGVEAAWVTNRDRARAPRSGRFWCGGCDANLVGKGERCRVCGANEYPATLRKDADA